MKRSALGAGVSAVSALGTLPVLFSLLALAALPWSCATATVAELSVADSANVRAVEAFFLDWRRDLQNQQWDKVFRGLSLSSHDWLKDLARSSRMDTQKELLDRSFEDIVFALILRVDRRRNPALDDRPQPLLERFLGEGSPLRRSFLKAELGAYVLRGSQATLGLREAPRVPVFHFVKERDGWHLDLRQTVPLALSGIESLSRPYGKNRIEQAVWLLRTWGGREVYAEDLAR